MSTKACPNCGTQISSQAIMCPKCKASLTKSAKKGSGFKNLPTIVQGLIIGAPILFVLLMIGLIGSANENKTESEAVVELTETGATQEQTSEVSEKPVETPREGGQPAVMDISAFIAEFDAGSDTANKKYEGKNLELTGPYVITIAARGTNTQGPYFMLAPIPNESYDGTVIHCSTTTEEAEKYIVGEQIRVIGTVVGLPSGYAGVIDMSDCVGK